MNTLRTFEIGLNKRKERLRDYLYFLQNTREHDESFRNNTYPHSENIFSLLNPLYLVGMKDFGQVNRYDFILVRDGLYSLADFFYRFSRPGGSETILLIHEKLGFIVPEEWQDNILTYNIQSKFHNDQSKIFPRSLYLLVFSCENEIRQQTLRQKISQVKSFYGENLHKINLKLGFFIRESPFYHYFKERPHDSLILMREFYTQLGLDYENISWREIVEEKNLHQSCYYYMSEEYFGHAYSYIDHFLLCNRCMPFDDRFSRKQEGDIVCDMLLNYDIHINEFSYQISDLWKEIIKMTSLLKVGHTLFHSEFFPYSWRIAEKYLFKGTHEKKIEKSHPPLSHSTFNEDLHFQQ